MPSSIAFFQPFSYASRLRLLDGDDELVDLRLVRLLVGIGETRRRRRLAQRLGERLVGAADLVERRGRPLGDAERDDVEEDAGRLLQELGLLLETRRELLHVARDLDLVELVEDALALHVARVRRGVLAVGPELALAMLADVDGVLERLVGALRRRRS